MLNEKRIQENIRCRWAGINEGMQALWVQAGANGGTLTQEQIEEIWQREQEEQAEHEKVWAMTE